MINVIFATQFKREFVNYPLDDQRKIWEFAQHLMQYGFDGLAGRNKPSDDVPFDDPDYVTKSEYAKENNLWHYHIGIPCYDETKSFGDRTSEYVLHYQKISETEIKLIDFSSHPPFKLPNELYLI